ncbi:MAG: rhomboid family intramembrane serine protease [Bacteroidales bacterium]|nr:rhomboid family intramembrane serine protease [Bacteroidales bacterium]
MTWFIIAITVIVTLLAFNQKKYFDQLKFNAYLIHKHKQFYRFLSYGLIHADWGHLLINMFVLFSFGAIVEEGFVAYFGVKGYLYFLILYVGAIAFSTLYDYGVHKNNAYYNAVGASGAVAAVVISSIIIYPQGRIFLFFIPIGIPAPVFGILYLIYSAFMAKRGADNIGHSAHFFGSIYGLVVTILLEPKFVTTFLNYLFTP